MQPSLRMPAGNTSWGSQQTPVDYSTLSGYTTPTLSQPVDYSLGVPNVSGGGINASPSVLQTNFGGGSTPAGGSNAFTDYLRSIGALGSTDKQGVKTEGWGGLAMGAAQGVGSLYLGMQQYNLAKDSLANNKAQFAQNYAAQRTTTNASLEDRQAARVASNPGAYQSVGSYMNQNRVV